jgi:hypothetical protein
MARHWAVPQCRIERRLVTLADGRRWPGDCLSTPTRGEGDHQAECGTTREKDQMDMPNAAPPHNCRSDA